MSSHLLADGAEPCRDLSVSGRELLVDALLALRVRVVGDQPSISIGGRG
jgi:hypothetical protein